MATQKTTTESQAAGGEAKEPQTNVQRASTQESAPRSQMAGRAGRGGLTRGGVSSWPSPLDLLSSSFSASPFSLMRRMMNDMSLFEDLLGGGGGARDVGLWVPDIEVVERAGEIVVRADLPGLREDDLSVEVIGDSLIIEGERQHREERVEGGVYRTERTYGSFRRVIPLPEGVDVDNATASFDNGVLEVALKLQEAQRQGKRIAIGGAKVEEEKGEKKEEAAEAPKEEAGIH